MRGTLLHTLLRSGEWNQIVDAALGEMTSSSYSGVLTHLRQWAKNPGDEEARSCLRYIEAAYRFSKKGYPIKAERIEWSRLMLLVMDEGGRVR